MEIIRVYGLVPKLQWLLHRYWDGQKVVLKSGKFFVHPFNTKRGVTQGYLVSPTIFNLLVDTVVRAALLEVCVPQEAQYGF